MTLINSIYKYISLLIQIRIILYKGTNIFRDYIVKPLCLVVIGLLHMTQIICTLISYIFILSSYIVLLLFKGNCLNAFIKRQSTVISTTVFYSSDEWMCQRGGSAGLSWKQQHIFCSVFNGKTSCRMLISGRE